MFHSVFYPWRYKLLFGKCIQYSACMGTKILSNSLYSRQNQSSMGLNINLVGELITIRYCKYRRWEKKYSWMDEVFFKKHKKNLSLPFENHLSWRIHGWSTCSILEYVTWGLTKIFYFGQTDSACCQLRWW